MNVVRTVACTLVLALVAMPTWARERDAPVRAAVDKFYAAFNSSGVSATMDSWDPNPLDINFSGLISGRATLEERIAGELKLGVKFDYKVDRIEVDGRSAWAAGKYTVALPSQDGKSAQISGAWLQVLKQEHGTWKIQAASFTRTNQPEKTPSN